MASLTHHALIWPYYDSKVNTAEYLSETALLLIALINVPRALIDSEQRKPDVYVQDILDIFDYVDQALQVWLPLFGACIIVTCFLFSMTRIIKSKIIQSSKQEKETWCKVKEMG